MQYEKGKPGQLHKNTLKMLKDRPRHVTFDIIAQATGLDAGWLKQFCQGRIADPSANRLEVLHAYLKR